MSPYLLFFFLFLSLFPAELSGDSSDSIDWSGFHWIIKSNRRKIGPGPNYFSSETISRNEDDSLSLHISSRRNRYYAAEIYTERFFSPGRFELTLELEGNPDSQAVFGFFLYNSEEPPHFNEIDYEMSRWAVPGSPESHFSVQPYTNEGNSMSFTLGSVEGRWRIVLNWQPDLIGFFIGPEGKEPVQKWIYRGDDNPRETESRVHINLWLFQGDPPAEDGYTTLRISDFRYFPYQ